MHKPEIAYIARINGQDLDLYPQNAEAWGLMFVSVDVDDHGVKHCQFATDQSIIDLFDGHAKRLGQRLYVYRV